MGRPGQGFDLDWRRLSRWCLLGTIVMVIWLLVPVAKCSLASFRDTPIGDASGDSPSAADKERIEAGEGFVGTWWSTTKSCYSASPLFGQGEWKTSLLLGFAGATLLTKLLAYFRSRRHGLG